MSSESFTEIDGIRCYAPEHCADFEHYPSDGFDVTDELEERSFWCRSRNRILKQLVLGLAATATAPGSPFEFLEIGCGTGFFMGALATDRRLKLTGSELYLRGLRSARRRLPDVEFIQMDASAIPFRERFDAVGAFDVIEHVEDDAAVVAGVSRALKPGGTFIVTVPQYRFLWSRLDELVHHKRRYSRRELVARLREGGFVVDYVSSFVFCLFPLMLASRLLDRLRERGRPPETDSKAAFASRVAFPSVLNRTFDGVMRVDELLIRLGVSLPFGGSLLAIARKPAATVTS